MNRFYYVENANNWCYLYSMVYSNLPSSFEGSFGHIRYYIEAHIHKTEFFSFDERKTVGITIQAPALASIQELGVI